MHNNIKLKVYKSAGTSFDKNTRACGSYSNAEIQIFLGAHSSVQQLCHTVVHEYKHYLLNEEKWNDIHMKMVLRGMHSNEAIIKHPHEKLCNKFEETWGPICFKELKNKLYKK